MLGLLTQEGFAHDLLMQEQQRPAAIGPRGGVERLCRVYFRLIAVVLKFRSAAVRQGILPWRLRFYSWCRLPGISSFLFGGSLHLRNLFGS